MVGQPYKTMTFASTPWKDPSKSPSLTWLILSYVLITLLIIPALANQAWASPNFFLRVTPTAGSIDETFLLAITLEDADASGTPELSGNDDFAVSLIGPQTSIQILNGHVSRSITWNYRLRARRSGDLQTPSADIIAGGVKMH
ncbi:MAG: BatD family protein, partial [Oligoflexia bacterium]|nr:BatD family protein [Oligoflexia bacterium]